MHRAYSLLTVKSVDDDLRVIEGIASSPTTDRTGDVVVSEGAKFALPIPLLWQHRSDQPIGTVTAAQVTSEGIKIRAQIARGLGIARIDEAWTLLKAGLVRGLSIGFRPLDDPEPIKGTFGLRFPTWEWLELSAVTIPANQAASISVVKQFDIGHAAPGSDRVDHPSAGASAVSPRSRRERSMKKTVSERVTDLKTERKTIADKMTALMQPVLDEEGELSDTQQKEYDDLAADLQATDSDIVRFEALERASVMPKAKAVVASTSEEAGENRGQRYSRISVKSNTPPEMEFVRYVICKAAARIFGVSPLDVAKERYPDNPLIQSVIKAAVAGATTTDATWAAPLLQDVRTLTGAFLEYLRPRTIIGRFGDGNIPSLQRVGFYERVQSQTSGGAAGWVGQAVQKPVTKFDYDSVTTTATKVAAISVLSDELIRFSTPSAEGRVRDALIKILVERLDRDFIDPDKAAVSNVSPASITNGITGLTPSSGGDAADVRTDVAAMLGAFVGTNQNVENLVWIMSGTSAMNLMLMRNALGNREFDGITVNGGTFEGFPVITSQYAAVVGSPTQNIVILMNPSEIFLADDGGVTVDMSNEASIEMSDDPANEVGTTVSMYQTNQVALRAERFIYWARGRASSVVWLDGAAWSAAA